MFSSRSLAAAAAALAFSASALAQAPYPGIGRAATPKEIAAWDIDVRPDFKGLPKGAGSVAKGQDVWEAKCAACHGVFGEANEVFSPLVGGTTADDVKTGRVARLTDPSFPGRTTLMKVATVSTLFDYIRRAMPWNAPKSLTVDEVYAVTAFLLNLGGVVDDNFELNERSIVEAQNRLPNRNGMRTDHALWPGAGVTPKGVRPDVKAVACMRDCATEAKVASFVPDYARNAHGNLSDQNRLVGPQRGAETGKGSVGAKAADASSGWQLAQKLNCSACHTLEGRLVGPALREVANKYSARPDVTAYLTGKIKGGGVGVWGVVPMPPQALTEADLKILAQWLADGAKK